MLGKTRTNRLLGIADGDQAGRARRLLVAGAGLLGSATLPKKGRTSASISRAWPAIAATAKAKKSAVKPNEKKSVVIATSTNSQSPIFVGVGKLPLGSQRHDFSCIGAGERKSPLSQWLKHQRGCERTSERIA